MKRIDQFGPDAFAEILKNIEEEIKPVPITSLPELGNQLGGGWFPGFITIVGPAGAGKTQFALQSILDAIRGGTPTIYLGLEMSATELIARLLGLMTRIPWSEVLRGKLNAKQVDRCRAAFQELTQLPLYYEEGKPEAYEYNRVGLLANQMRNLYPGGHIMLVVDYLQLLGAAGRQDLRERTRSAAYSLKTLSRDRKMVIICLSSTARSNYEELSDGSKSIGTGDPGRLLGTGKESGEIEYGADVVLVLARQLPDPGEGIARITIAIAKVRAGVRSWIPTCFYDGNRFEYDPDPDFAFEVDTEKIGKGRQKPPAVQLDPRDKRAL